MKKERVGKGRNTANHTNCVSQRNLPDMLKSQM